MLSVQVWIELPLVHWFANLYANAARKPGAERRYAEWVTTEWDPVHPGLTATSAQRG
jgi:hypothetical protein